jgi:rare lipoprotein A
MSLRAVAALSVLLALTLSSCASKPERRSHKSPTPAAQKNRSSNQTNNRFEHRNSDSQKTDPCAPVYQHDESRYTPGGLYAPELSDSAPISAIDVSQLIEPTPSSEPLARYGNKSPYTVLGKTYYVLDKSNSYDQRGTASWYGQKFNGRKTSSGEIYSICQFTAAHKTLPLPSYVRVTNIKNGQSVVVRINDRGPFHEGRIIDLSYVAAIRIGLDKAGTAPVRVELIHAGDLYETRIENTPIQNPSINANANANANDHDNEDISLQFGSFVDQANAQRLRAQLQNANIQGVELEKAQLNEKSVWRVLARGLKNEQIDDIFEIIHRLGLAKPKVISQKL